MQFIKYDSSFSLKLLLNLGRCFFRWTYTSISIGLQTDIDKPFSIYFRARFLETWHVFLSNSISHHMLLFGMGRKHCNMVIDYLFKIPKSLSLWESNLSEKFKTIKIVAFTAYKHTKCINKVFRWYAHKTYIFLVVIMVYGLNYVVPIFTFNVLLLTQTISILNIFNQWITAPEWDTKITRHSLSSIICKNITNQM